MNMHSRAALGNSSLIRTDWAKKTLLATGHCLCGLALSIDLGLFLYGLYGISIQPNLGFSSRVCVLQRQDGQDEDLELVSGLLRLFLEPGPLQKVELRKTNLGLQKEQKIVFAVQSGKNVKWKSNHWREKHQKIEQVILNFFQVNHQRQMPVV